MLKIKMAAEYTGFRIRAKRKLKSLELGGNRVTVCPGLEKGIMSWCNSLRRIARRTCSHLCGTAAVFVLVGAVVSSQQTRALRGRVTDEYGHAVAGAVVQLQNSSTIWIRSYITQRDGLYYFYELLTDTSYQVQAKYKGAYSRNRSLSKFNSRAVATIDL